MPEERTRLPARTRSLPRETRRPAAGPARALATGLAVVALLAACASPRIGPARDGAARAQVVLTGDEREHFVAGMRAYLEATQAIVDAIAADKPEQLAQAARKVGMSAVQDASPSLALKMPAEFVMLALDTHQKFDALAAAATSRASRKALLDQLSAILANCSACHAMYELAGRPASPPQPVTPRQ